MNNLVELNNSKVVTTSLQVAESFGKEHKHVLRDIRSLLKDVSKNEPMFLEGNSPDSYGRDRKIYYIDRDGFALLAMGFTGKKALQFKLDYIQAFNAMEKQIGELALEENKSFIELKSTVDNLVNNLTIDYSQQKRFEDTRKAVVLDALGGYGSNAYKQIGKKVFAACGKDIKNRFGIPRYNELRRQDFEAAIDYLSDWKPQQLLALEIAMHNGQLELTL